jgi:hypothetical protein
MSFALLESTDDILAAKGNYTIAVVKGKEDYAVLKNCFKDVLSDINDMYGGRGLPTICFFN